MKVKRIFSVAIACAVMASGVLLASATLPVLQTSALWGEDYTEGTYEALTYRAYSNRIEIIDCDEAVTEVVIPEEIDGLPVTIIGNSAFYGCVTLKSISIPNTITEIGANAFRSCESLSNIIIPNSVISIKEYAFECCDALTSITIPASVNDINGAAFSYCYTLTEFIVDENNAHYSSDDGILFNKEKTKLIECPRGKSGVYTIPDGVVEIENYAFSNCALQKVTIPDSVIEISFSTFNCCTNLTDIIIPAHVAVIEQMAFIHCNNLTNVTILNPECEIADYSDTFSNDFDESLNTIFTGTIYGYEGSTAQAYAEKYERTFIPLINGDADLDGELGIADVVKIMTHTTTPGGTLSEIEMINADVYQTGDGISNMDALAVQKKIAQLISELPESELDLV